MTIDPATGALTVLSTLGDESVVLLGPSAAVDPATHRFFITSFRLPSGDRHILTVDTQTGAAVESPELTRDVGLEALGFDPAIGLFGVTSGCCPIDFVTIDPATGVLAVLSSIGDEAGSFSNTGAVDPATHRFFITKHRAATADFHILTVDTQTGAAVESPALTRGVFALGFDPGIGLFGVSGCCPSECCRYDFVTIDPATGALTVLSSIGSEPGSLSDISAVDPATHRFFMVKSRFVDGRLRTQILTIDTQTGAAVESPEFNRDEPLIALGFDPTATSITAESICDVALLVYRAIANGVGALIGNRFGADAAAIADALYLMWHCP